MGLKDWPYWLKGGIILGIVSFFILILFFSFIWIQHYNMKYPPISLQGIAGGITGGGSECYVYEWLSGSTNEVIQYGYVDGRKTLSDECTGILSIHIGIIIFFTFIAFLIGSIIGLIYGKIKKK